jgi:dTDP-4-amino-4,6-dideoxygalactose transaminase
VEAAAEFIWKSLAQEMRPQESLPAARELGETSMMLLAHPTMSDADMQYVSDVLAAMIASATS